MSFVLVKTPKLHNYNVDNLSNMGPIQQTTDYPWITFWMRTNFSPVNSIIINWTDITHCIGDDNNWSHCVFNGARRHRVIWAPCWNCWTDLRCSRESMPVFNCSILLQQYPKEENSTICLLYWIPMLWGCSWERRGAALMGGLAPLCLSFCGLCPTSRWLPAGITQVFTSHRDAYQLVLGG